MRTDLLIELANFLDALPPERFDYRIWTSNDWDKENHSCGTKACALGWAASIPQFQEMRLMIGPMGNIRFKKYRDYQAAAMFFEIPPNSAEYLFSPIFSNSGLGCDASPGQVADLIRKFVCTR